MAYRRFAVVLLIIMMIAASACVLAQETVKLELKFTPGETLRYKMIMDGSLTMTSTDPSAPRIPNTPIRMVGIIREHVKRVLPGGDAEVSAAVESMKFEMAGKTKELPKKQATSMTMVIGTNGQIRSAQGSAKAMGGMRFMDPGTLGQFGALPSGELTVGESWSKSAPFPYGGGDILLIGRLLSANDRLGDTRVAIVKQDISGDIDLVSQLASLASGKSPVPPGAKAGGKFSGSGLTFFSPERGRVMRTECTFGADMNASAPAASGKGPSGGMSMSFAISFEMYLLPSM